MNNPDYIKLIDIKKEALESENRIREHIIETHVEYSPSLSQSGNCNVYLKLENLQLSGSFKLRGVMNKLLSLAPKDRKAELVTADEKVTIADLTGVAVQDIQISKTVYEVLSQDE